MLSVLTAIAAMSGNALAGDLNPPSGAVAPTMKTLDQVEARIPIPGGLNQPRFTITQPGSYYLTGNRLHTQGNIGASIEVMVSDVTIDLSGFAITVTNPSGAQYAIRDRGDDGSSGISGVVVRNGVISGSGYDEGGIGLSYTSGARVESVTARGITGGTGIYVGPGGMVIDSSATGCRTGFGGSNATFLRCAGVGNNDRGFDLFNSSAKECVAINNSDYGFLLNYRATVESSIAKENETGIYVVGDGCRVDSNTVSGGRWGIFLGSNAVNTIVTRNTVRQGLSSPYGMNLQTPGNFPNNHVAQIISDPTNQFTTTNPWANFAH
jgi:parallel beta-helix repeat protein